jgi:hypothetical protein
MPPIQQERCFRPFILSIQVLNVMQNFRMKVEWLVDLPKVHGRFGCPHNVGGLDSCYAVCARGSMDESLLNESIKSVIMPLYPIMHKSAVFYPITGRLI